MTFSFWFYLLLSLFVVNAVAVIVMENRRPVETIAWLLVLVCFPVFGLVVYFVFGHRPRRRLISAEEMELLHERTAGNGEEPEGRMQCFLTKSGAELTRGNDIRVFVSFGEMLEAMMADIERAHDFISFQFFKFEDDETGRRVSDALISKARAGMEVRVLYDALACISVPSPFFRRMREAGVEVRAFNRALPRPSSFSNIRNHRKVVVVDGRAGYIGGMNIAHRYLTGIRTGRWRDTHARLTGPSVAALMRSFAVDWRFAGGELLADERYYRTTTAERDLRVQIAVSNATDRPPVMALALPEMVARAEGYVWLQSPYFIPTEQLASAMVTAARAGVDVRMMLPRRCDKGVLLPLVSQSNLGVLLRAGVRVFMYEQGFLHAKTAVADDRVATIGSTNIDPRSIYMSFEINAFIYDRAEAERMRGIYEADMQSCHELTLEEWQGRGRWQRVRESLARLFTPIL